MRVIVIGAGILGTSIAYQLGKRGAEVTLIDKAAPGQPPRTAPASPGAGAFNRGARCPRPGRVGVSAVSRTHRLTADSEYRAPRRLSRSSSP
ncbi:FAD-dependent oxidoreductase [Microbacterium sp. SD291]|uniref:FAD-dependent oxidoreductase n=1 Tax=Microbacterium sp. SD291 TaxID=2782007 RepID=UPI001A961397|nr:FAD-dependent oxidoreductase [Microbacterium sp. SD291]MBO0982140.1 FAD-dependent oxidoreductase [Microbacterium sp. SD291]